MSRASQNRATSSWKRRLEILHDNILQNIEICKQPNANEEARSKLRILTNRFNEDLHASMDKLSDEQIEVYTLLQIEAETLSIVTARNNERIQVKLPKLELLKFSGDVLKWNEFWDSYCSSVHSQNICDANKLSYLMASLEGEALATVSGLEATNDNYIIAVDLLKERYGKIGMILDAHYHALTNMPRATLLPKDCLDKFNDIERHLRVLKARGEDTNHNQLRSLIISKFPDQLIQELRTKIKVEEEDVNTIRKHLEHLITARIPTDKTTPPHLTAEALLSRAQFERKQTVWKRRNDDDNQHYFTKKKKKFNPCIFCKGQHYNDQCSKSLKDRKLMLKDKCFICFNYNHIARNCRSNKSCQYCGNNSHNSAICPTFVTPKQRGFNRNFKTLQARNDICETTILQTAIVEIYNSKGETTRCRALLDTGSQRSYITSEAAKKLNLEILEQNVLTVFTFGSNQPTEIQSPCTEVKIKGVKIRMNIVPYITEDVDYPNPILMEKVPPEITNVADDGSLGKQIDLLIGNDYYHTFVYGRKYNYQGHLYLVASAFGWIWTGTSEGISHKERLSVLTYVQGTPLQSGDTLLDQPLQNTAIHKLWDLETIGITDCPKTTRDDQAVEEFNRCVKYEDGRYWVKWPWCYQPSNLPDNFELAYGRLRGLLKRIDQTTLLEYSSVLQDQIEKGVIEVVNEEVSTNQNVHYLPHHYVRKDGKLRIVYDASSKLKGQRSLNECLYRGPVMLENLIGMIIRFRCYKYGIIADVEKAFLQIGLQTEDRDVTRFLWIKDPSRYPSADNLLHLRFTRVPFGIGCSPFLLAITLKHQLTRDESPLCKRIAQDIYVDNLVSGCDSREECLQFYHKTKEVFEAISMKMRDWYTNNTYLYEAIDGNLIGQQNGTASVLGINWIIQRDILTLKINKEFEPSVSSITKRQILAQISSIFDPCGFVTPLLVRPKLFLQNLWKCKVEWDTSISAELQSEWNEIVAQIKECKDVRIPRWYGIEKPLNDIECNLEIHCFVDASMNAYAAAVYLKVSQNNNNKISLIMSKSRLTPIKNKDSHTVPRLELLAALIGCRLINFIKGRLPITITNTYLWSDSQVVLQWINSTRVLPPFVSARVNEIKRSTEIEFRYIPTSLNPADIATRPCQNLVSCQQWLEGPTFLYKDKSDWPKHQTFEHCLLSRTEESELQIIKDLQRRQFPEEMNKKKTNLAKSLGIFDDNGILRCKGRFKYADWPVDQKYPILLPKDTDYTYQTIENTHKRLYHVGVSQTLAAVRQKYWIPHGRSQVQKVLHRCKECRKYGGGPYKLPPMAPLPKDRFNIMTKPFSSCGIDYLGPLYVTAPEGFPKRWICLFTCLGIRAIHLEVVMDLTAEECTMAIRRFVATRGTPKKFLSDNATNFTLTAKIMEEIGIEWNFIPELAPWFGGVYERMVGLVKHCLRRTIDKQQLNNSQLITIVKEIESVINERPLTTVGSNVETILTPSSFLQAGGPLLIAEKGNYSGSETKKSLIEGWKKGKKVLEDFMKMFKDQYLASLRERNTQLKEKRATHKRPPRVGDVVQIKEDTPRVKWKVGKIRELIGSNDSEIRVAVVDLDGGGNLKRSISHLYPLEVDLEEVENETTPKTIAHVENKLDREVTNKGEPSSEERPNRTRKSAIEARKKMAEWLRLTK